MNANLRSGALTHLTPACPGASLRAEAYKAAAVCMRDVQEVHTPSCVDSFLQPSCVCEKRAWVSTYESEVSCCPSIRRISSMCGWWCWASYACVLWA